MPPPRRGADQKMLNITANFFRNAKDSYGPGSRWAKLLSQLNKNSGGDLKAHGAGVFDLSKLLAARPNESRAAKQSGAGKRGGVAVIADYLAEPLTLPKPLFLPEPLALLSDTPAQQPRPRSHTLVGNATHAGRKRSSLDASPAATCPLVPPGDAIQWLLAENARLRADNAHLRVAAFSTDHPSHNHPCLQLRTQSSRPLCRSMISLWKLPQACVWRNLSSFYRTHVTRLPPERDRSHVCRTHIRALIHYRRQYRSL